jgi:hypothetical protein
MRHIYAAQAPFEQTLKAGDDVRLVFTIIPSRPTQTLTAAVMRFWIARTEFADAVHVVVEKEGTAESALVVHVDLTRADTLPLLGDYYCELAAQGIVGWTTLAVGTITFEKTLIRK